MLRIVVPPIELWDERREEFIETKSQVLQLEHSLVSISKWESKWEKAFLGKRPKTNDEIRDYVRCMTLTQNVDPMIYYQLSDENIKDISAYIEKNMTATVLYDEENQKKSSEVVTSELIYYWMIAFNIPFKCEKWHLNRLLTLIRVCERKNRTPKKMSQHEMMKRNSSLNARRRKQLHTRG